MPTLNDFITEIITGEYGLDVVNYGKDSNGDFQPFEVDIDGKQYVIDEATATKLDTLIEKDFATETTLDTRLSSLEAKMDSLLNSQDVDDNIKVSQNGSNVEINKNSLTFSNLNAGESESIYIQPNIGTLKIVKNINAFISWSGASSGNVVIKFFQGDSISIEDRIFYINSGQTNERLNFKPHEILFGEISEPKYLNATDWSKEAFEYLRNNIKYSNSNGLTIKIENNLDVQFTFTRFILFEEVIG